MRGLTLCAAVCVLLVASMRVAKADSIDFETLSDGSTSPTATASASTEYSTSGVTFSGGGVAGQPVFRSWSDLSAAIADRPPAGNDWFITTLAVADPSDDFDMDITFSAPVLAASGDLVVHPNYSVSAYAYDSSDNLLGSVTIPSGESTWIAGSFNFSYSQGIARIHILPSGSAAGLDNFNFTTTAVPEPTSLALFGLGAGALALRRRRRKLA